MDQRADRARKRTRGRVWSVTMLRPYLVLLVVVAFAVAMAWLVSRGWRSPLLPPECKTRYARAKTQADTAAIDQLPVISRSGTLTCGEYRRLDQRRSLVLDSEPLRRHQRSIAR